MTPLAKIGKRLARQAKEVGLELRDFAAKPNLEDEDGPHHAQAVFTLTENFTPEPPKDDEWEKFEQEQAKNEAEKREKEAKEGLAKLTEELSDKLKDRNKGIL
jgi:hypothetical protein